MPVNVEEVILKKQLLELRKKKLALLQKAGIYYYQPHAKQDAFHSAANYRFRLFRAGNRTGKSECGVSEDLAFALGERPWYEKGDPRRTVGIPTHPTKGLVVAASSAKVDEIFTGDGSKGNVGKIWKKLPKDLVVGKPKRDSSGVINSIRIKGIYGESVIMFQTREAYKNNAQAFESSDFDWVHIDEPVEESLWKAVLRGLTDRGGKAWFTCTLLEQPWINDLFFPDMAAQKKEFYAQAKGTRKFSWVCTGSIYDNPHLSKDDIQDFLDALTEEERECRINGIPLHLSGLVHKKFDFATHVLSEPPAGWKSFDDPPLNYTIHLAIDPHPRTPTAVLFCAVAPSGRRYYYDEIFQALDNQSLAAEINQKLLGRFVWTKLSDPAAWIMDERYKTTQVDDWAKYGLVGVEKGSKDLSRCIRVCNHNLEHDDGVFFSPNLKTFLWEIGRYAWADKNGVPVNKPVDKDDHLIECWHRLELEGPTYADQTKATPVEEMAITGGVDEEGDWGDLSYE